MERGAEPPSPISSHSTRFSPFAPLPVATLMEPIQRFNAVEKGKTPLDGPVPLPPKKRPVHRGDAATMQVVTRPWCERPPPGYPLPLYAQAGGSGGRGDERQRARRGHASRAAVACIAAPGVHATDSSRELVLWVVMPPSTWICFPSFFSAEMPPRGPLSFGCSTSTATRRRLERRLRPSPRGRSS